MSVEEQVDRLLQNKDKKVAVKHFKFNRKHFLIAFGSMVVTTTLLLMMLIPAYDKRTQEFFGAGVEPLTPYGGGTIVNDSITWSNDYGTLTVTPHTSTNIITQTQYANFTSNITNDIDVAFRFDDSIDNKDIWMWKNISHNVNVPNYGFISSNYTLYDISDVEVINESVANASGLNFGDVPSVYYRRGNASYWDGSMEEWLNGTFIIGFDDFFPKPMNPDMTTFFYEYWGITGYHIEEQFWFDWKDVSSQFNHQLYNGKHYYYVSDVPVVQGKSYPFKWQYDIPLVNFKSSGKWDLMAKLHSMNLETALATGNFIMIDPWWSSEWSYSKVITVTNPIEDYQTKIIVANVSGGDVDCEGHANSDFSDLRFVNSTNTSELPYWIENYTADIAATIWVNNTWNESTINMYYGNSSATNNSNGAATFDFFDNFNDASIDATLWKDNDLDDPTESGGYLIMDNDDRIRTQNVIPVEPCRLRSKAWISSDDDVNGQDVMFLSISTSTWDAGNDISMRNSDAAAQTLVSDIQCWADEEPSVAVAGYGGVNCKPNNTYMITWIPDTNASYYQGDVLLAGFSTPILDTSKYFFIYVWDSSQEATEYIDWFFIGKYNSTEPSFAFGSELSQPAPNNEPSISGSSIYPNTGTTSTIYYFNVTYTDVDDDSPGNISINITMWGTNWYSNNSMSWVSGSNITGAVYSYNTNSLGVGDYNFTIYADDGNTSTTKSITPLLGAFSYSTLRNETFTTAYGYYGQGAATNGTHVFTSSKTDDNTYPGTLNRWDMSYTNEQETELGGEVDHISDCYYKDGYIYVADAYAYDGDFDASYPYVARYWANDTFVYIDIVLNESVAGGGTYLTEGVTFYDDSWWLCSGISTLTHGNVTRVRRYDSDWVFMNDFILKNASGDSEQQGMDFIEIENITYLFVTYHRNVDEGLQIFRWNDTGFTELYWYDTWDWANQGFQFNGSLDSVWFMNRGDLDSNWLLEIDFDKASDTSIGPVVKVKEWQVINNTYNGSLFNQSQFSVWSSTVNGSAFNQSQWSLTQSDINGSLFNQSQWDLLFNNINGSLWNVSQFSIFSNEINGSIFNQSQWFNFNLEINGSVYNGSQWSLISDTINGSLYNISQFTEISNSINGSLYNTSQYSIISNNVNGSLFNQSQYSIISNSINGSLYNSSAGLNTTVDTISPYNQTSSPLEITASVDVGNATPDNVTLWYRYSTDNSTWGDSYLSFGENGTGNITQSVLDDVVGSPFTTTLGGTANNITAYLRSANQPNNISCAIYLNSTNMLVTNGVTEERIFQKDSYGWETFNFTGTKPVLVANTEYFLTLWAHDGDVRIGNYNDTIGYKDDQSYDYPNFPEPHAKTAFPGNDDGPFCIYCNYTVSGGLNWTEFSEDIVSPWNWSFNFPNSTGYYEFYSIANLSGETNESAPSSADALCYFEAVNWSVINNTINGSIYNVSQFSLVSSNINGSLYNGSVYNIINNTLNGSLWNTSAYVEISNTINGSLWNSSAYVEFSNTINGTVYNGTQFSLLNNSINGSLYNTSADDTSYYVSNAGADSNDGLSIGSPWQNMSKVNSELNGGVINAGDNVYFNRGDTWNGTSLGLRLGGNSSNWMIFGAYGTGANPIINGTSDDGIELAVENISHIRVENINVTNTYSASANPTGVRIRQAGTHNITLYNVNVNNSDGNGIIVSSIDHYRIENCTVNYAGTAGIAVYGSGPPGARNGITRNCSVYYANTDGYTYHDLAAGQPIGSNHLIENCVAYTTVPGVGAGEEGFDITSGQNILIRNCEAYDNNDESIVLGHGVENVTLDNFYSHDENNDAGIAITHGEHVTIRNSIFENAGTYLLWMSLGAGSSHNTTVYNNDFLFGSSSDRVYFNYQSATMQDTTLKNNIYYSYGTSYPNYFFATNLKNMSESNTNSSYNMYWRSGDTDSSDRWKVEGVAHNFNEWIALSETDGELRNNPGIADAAGGDFSLNDTSPCIDAGDWLTTTVGSDTGTVINVSEADYFFGGFPNITTETISGDNIFVGDDTDLEVIYVNHFANTISVNRSITWSDGDDVSLSGYSGSKVDIGAVEYAAATYWQLIDSTINGSIYNGTQFSTINNSINGSIYNQTQFSLFSSDINGSLWNFSDDYTVFSDTINGSLFNTSQWTVIANNINGSLWNVSGIIIFSNTINGSLFNGTGAYPIIDNSINGSLFNASQDPTIDNVYPANGSNILVVQPTVYFNLTSPLGYTMNYSVWIGSSSDSCNTLIYSGVNVTNGTQVNSAQLYHTATDFYESYWWRVSVNDGTTSINESFYFQTIQAGGGGGYIPVSSGLPIAGIALLIAVVALVFILQILRRRREEE